MSVYRFRLWGRAFAFATPVAGIVIFAAASLCAAQTVRKMEPNPPEQCSDIGTEEGMPLYPSEPVPGFPGMDPDIPGREPRNTPMYLPYEGSLELYHRNAGYHPKILPYNHRTLIKNWIAVDMPGVPDAEKEQFRQTDIWLKPGAGWWIDYVPTGKLLDSEPVVRLTPGGRGLPLDVGELDSSMYVIRVIGAVEHEHVKPYPDDLILELRINDGDNGEVNSHLMRIRAMDAFFEVGRFYFHVVDDRDFSAELRLHRDSEIDLLVYNVDLHDVLGECARRAGKRASILAPNHVLESNWGVEPEEMIAPAREGNWMAVYTQPARNARLAELRAEFPDAPDDELMQIWRRRRDQAIWNAGPPLNVNLMGDDWGGLPIEVPMNYSKVDPDTEAQYVNDGILPEGYRDMDEPDTRAWRRLPLGYSVPADLGPWRLVDPETGETVYTREDLLNHKPYPGLPDEVRPWGKRYPSDIPGDERRGEEGYNKSFYFAPVTQALGGSVFAPNIRYQSYVERGDIESARDMSIKLVRWAYHLPAMQPNRYLSRLCAPSVRSHLRWMRFYQYLDDQYVDAYDQLFSFIVDNQELADAVNEFIPWVETPEDVIALLDTYQLQYLARQQAYWRQNWYSHGSAGRHAKIVAIQMDPAIVEPWVNLIFSRTHTYPFPLAGIQELLYMSVQRDGTTNIGSSYYTFGASVDAARWLKVYIENGGDPRYDLTDPHRYPRVTTGLYWMIDGWVAGGHHLAIGDVGGFYRTVGQWLEGKLISTALNEAWQWTRDPKFAWLIRHYGSRGQETDEEWNEIVAAAENAPNPYMSNSSRVLSDWGGIMEGGGYSDDFRFRHAIRVRVGYGTGHAHSDGLDLAFWSLGVPLNICAGARGGYAYPGIGGALNHNVVSIDGESWSGCSWVDQMADMGECQYLSARGMNQEKFRRQVALVEIDQGEPADQPTTHPRLLPTVYRPDGGGVQFDQNVTLPRAYVFDVFRVRGGKEHVYNFHGFPHDSFDVNVQPDEPRRETEERILSQYILDEEGAHWAGTVEDDHLQATWMLNREVREIINPQRPEQRYIAHRPQGYNYSAGAEQWMLGSAFDPEAPRRFLRVHLFGQQGARMVTGEAIITPYGIGRSDGEFHRNVHVIPAVDNAGQVVENLFVSIWEPYSGEPTIASARMEGDPRDAAGYAAVHVETVDGQRDVCFADGANARPRRLEDGTIIDADFAYISRDDEGLKRISMVGGRSIEVEGLSIKPNLTRHEGRVVDVDYLTNTLTLDRPLSARMAGRFFEVGAPRRGIRAERWTSFEAAEVTPKQMDGQTELRWRKGADVFSGEIKEIPRKADMWAWQPNEIITTLAPPLKYGEHSQLAATVEGKDQGWRADVEVRGDYRGVNAQNGRITLYDAPFTHRVPEEEGEEREVPILAPGDRINLWAFGEGDVWRAPANITLIRQGEGVYTINGDVGCIITGIAAWSDDGAEWHEFPDGEARISAEQAAAGDVFFRLQ